MIAIFAHLYYVLSGVATPLNSSKPWFVMCWTFSNITIRADQNDKKFVGPLYSSYTSSADNRGPRGPVVGYLCMYDVIYVTTKTATHKGTLPSEQTVPIKIKIGQELNILSK